MGMGFLFPSGRKNPGRALVYGLVTMWAVTFVYALFLIFFYNSTELLMKLIIPSWLVIFVAGLAAYIVDTRKNGFGIFVPKLTRPEILFLGLFLGLLLFQLYKSVAYAYADGDDAYYVATAQLSSFSDLMYRQDPYTGMLFDQGKRYFLAPFPVWLSIISRITGLNAAAVAHVVAPVALIPVTYIIYSEIGVFAFKENKEARYIYLCMIAVFVLFSGYSLMPAERFLLTRTRQGKEALANIIIPGALMLFGDAFVHEEGLDREKTLLLFLFGLAGALTSFFSNLLLGILGVFWFILCIVRKQGIKALIRTAIAMIPEALMIVLYMVL